MIQTEKILFAQKATAAWQQFQTLRQTLYKEIFTDYLQIEYQIHDIPITEIQTVHTVFLPSLNHQRLHLENYYFGHGFGASSIMNFAVLGSLLQKGNVILWEIRGMGFGYKQTFYNIKELPEIQQFYLAGIEAILKFYDHNNATLIGHSLSSYLILAFILRKDDLANQYIKQVLAISPAGITTKQEDYKASYSNVSDCCFMWFNKCAWLFNLTFKSPFRLICCCQCLQRSLIMREIKKTHIIQKQQILMCKIIQTLIVFPDGSQSLFFKYFEPRVLPKIALQPLFTKQPCVNITIVYGGQQDWIDKSGAVKIAERFPERIRKIEMPTCGHNIPFEVQQCKQLFEIVFK